MIIDLFLSLIFIGSFRISKRLFLEGENDKSLKKTLLIGVSPFTQALFKQKNSFYISAIVDDTNSIIGSYFSNINIQKFQDIEKIIKNDSIESVIITKELERDVLQSIYARLYKLNIYDIKLAIISNQETRLKNLSVEDLLARHPKDLDKRLIANFIKDKTVLITGAGGSIGSEISKQCEKFGAKKLILLDNSEYNLYQITEKIKVVRTISIMQSVQDKELVDATFKDCKPDIVIHAAAYKHVPLVEENIKESINNNVIGTKNVIDISIKYGIEKFILISTDKAVRPTNV
ncbi:MAG: SDR family NAD(P)-dependent oxidoreductase, partial [Campylobacterota bacterium]|nr:SDR family NAD(P)-dependent oxidoreductase [Campylobacterota bacterium]